MASERPGEDIDVTDPELSLKRELSELSFQSRVLPEAEDARTPFLERVRFLATVTQTMDEFFTQRNGGLKQQIAAGVTEPIPDARQPSEQWSEAMATAHDLLERQAQPKSA